MQWQNIITIESSKSRRDVYFDTRDVRKSVADPCDGVPLQEELPGLRSLLFTVAPQKEWSKNWICMRRSGIRKGSEGLPQYNKALAQLVCYPLYEKKVQMTRS
jgi:hypothetical protein